MEKEYVCVKSNDKSRIGLVFKLDECCMGQISTQRWETKTYHLGLSDAVYAEKQDVTYLVTHGDEYVVLDLNGYPYYKGGFQYLWHSPKWIQEKDYLVCAEYVQDFKVGDIVKLKSKEETRLEVVENVLCRKTYTDGINYKAHYTYKLKEKNELYTVNDIQLAFKKDEFEFKRCIQSPRGGLVTNRIYRCCDYDHTYSYWYRRVCYESGFSKTLSRQQLKYDYRFVDATLEEYMEQYNAQFEPKQNRVRTYSYSKRKEDGKAYRDNFADFMNGKACVHINSESDMNWFRLALQQYGLEHKLGFTYRSFDVKPEYLAYSEDKVKFAYGIETVADYHMKVLEVTDLL